MGTALRVLAVDDERLVRMSIRHVLGREGLEIDTARTAAEAFDLLGQHHYDLVLTDLELPDSSGLEILHCAKRHDPGARVIIITASRGNMTPQAAREAGAVALIHKPFELAALVAQALEAVHGRAANH